jgi:digeranylgeranylglycerophospholipid reductase
MRCDLAIVGGGPVGCMTAAQMRRGSSVVILEEHGAVGVPEQCSGLIAPRVVQMANAQGSILNHIDGAVLHFPSGREIRLKGQEIKAYVVDRRLFDERCMDQAVNNGAEYRTGTKFKEARRENGAISLTTSSDHVLHAKMAIGADGYRSSLGRAVGLLQPKEQVRGIQVDLRCRTDDQSSVDVWIGSEMAPGFFAWRIPCGDFTRIGLCISSGHGNPSSFLNHLLKRSGHDGQERLRLYSGVIPLGPRRNTSTDQVILVGDAAGQVKPLSGGGLFTGLTAASLAAQVASDAIEANDTSARMLRRYDRIWRDAIGKEIDRSYRVRKAYVRLNDEQLDLAGRLFDTDEARAVLSKGDIDHPTDIAGELIRAAPGLMRFSPQLLASVLTRS